MADKWPEDRKSAYIDRCSKTIAIPELEASSPLAYCTCIANGMEEEFKAEEDDQMMKAQPNPQGNEYDKRLYTVFKPCVDHLPR